MDIIPKRERLVEFVSALNEAVWSPTDAESANAFLRKHLDEVEEAMLDARYHKDYTRRMLIPSFDIECAWHYDKGIHRWGAFGHTVEIYDSGSAFIKTLTGEILFSAL